MSSRAVSLRAMVEKKELVQAGQGCLAGKGCAERAGPEEGSTERAGAEKGSAERGGAEKGVDERVGADVVRHVSSRSVSLRSLVEKKKLGQAGQEYRAGKGCAGRAGEEKCSVGRAGADVVTDDVMMIVSGLVSEVRLLKGLVDEMRSRVKELAGEVDARKVEVVEVRSQLELVVVQRNELEVKVSSLDVDLDVVYTVVEGLVKGGFEG